MEHQLVQLFRTRVNQDQRKIFFEITDCTSLGSLN